MRTRHRPQVALPTQAVSTGTPLRRPTAKTVSPSLASATTPSGRKVIRGIRLELEVVGLDAIDRDVDRDDLRLLAHLVVEPQAVAADRQAQRARRAAEVLAPLEDVRPAVAD